MKRSSLISTRESPPTLNPFSCLIRRIIPWSPKRVVPVVLALAMVGLFAASAAHASTTTFTTSSDSQTYVASGSQAGSSFEGKGAVEIAAATTSQPDIEEALFSFNTASIASQFNALYGINGWTITSASVTLNSNYPSAGTQPNNASFNVIDPGLFQLSWLSNNSWNQNTVTYNTISTYLPGTGNNNQQQTFGTYYYFADGTSTLTWVIGGSTGLLSGILSGGEISIFGTPDDNVVGYLFNTNTKGDPPILDVTAEATPTPVPPALLLLGSGLAGLGFLRRRIFNG